MIFTVLSVISAMDPILGYDKEKLGLYLFQLRKVVLMATDFDGVASSIAAE